MARSVQEIKKTMTDAFVADPTIRERYQLEEGDTFERRFSAVSLESILFFVVAASCHVLERLFDQFKVEVAERIERSVVATLPWYHQMARAYQHGDTLVLDEETMRYVYPRLDESKQVVRYAAVTDRGGSIRILVAGQAAGKPVPLSEDVLTAFRSYMGRIKMAGVVLSVRSLPADAVEVEARIQVDPMILSSEGLSYQDGTRPVETAISTYLQEITYGGVLNKTKLVDAIQLAHGVLDVVLVEVRVRPHGGQWRSVSTNNYTAASGCFDPVGLRSTLTYTR